MLPPHHPRGHHPARGAAAPGRRLRRGAGRGDRAQPARRRLLQPGGHPAGAVAREPGQGRPAGGHPRRLEPALQHRLRVPARGRCIYLTTSLSENNLFGWRKKASLAFDLYRGNYVAGPHLPRSQRGRHPPARSPPRYQAYLRPGHQRPGGRQPGRSASTTRCSRWPAAGAPACRPGTPTGSSVLRSQRAGPALPDRPCGAGAEVGRCSRHGGRRELAALPYIYRVRRKSVDAERGALVRQAGHPAGLRRLHACRYVRPGFSPSVSRGRPGGARSLRPAGLPAHRADLGAVRRATACSPRATGSTATTTPTTCARTPSWAPAPPPPWLAAADLAGLGRSATPGLGGQPRLDLRSGRRLPAAVARLGRALPRRPARRRDPLGRRHPGHAHAAARPVPAGRRGRRVACCCNSTAPDAFYTAGRRVRPARLRPGRVPRARPASSATSRRAPARCRWGPCASAAVAFYDVGHAAARWQRPARLPRRRRRPAPADPPAQLLRPAGRLGLPLPARATPRPRLARPRLRRLPPGVLDPASAGERRQDGVDQGGVALLGAGVGGQGQQLHLGQVDHALGGAARVIGFDQAEAGAGALGLLDQADQVGGVGRDAGLGLDVADLDPGPASG